MKPSSALPSLVVLVSLFFTQLFTPEITLSGPKLTHSGIETLIKKNVKKNLNIYPKEKTLKRLEKYYSAIKLFCSYTFILPDHTVNPNYILGLMSQESKGNPQALSNKGAYGLTQIMPETGVGWGKELYNTKFDFPHINEERLKELQSKDLFDPYINILLACYGTSKYNYIFNGDITLVAAAWNAGLGAVFDNKGCPPIEETIEFIGYVNGFMTSFMDKRLPSKVPSRNFPTNRLPKNTLSYLNERKNEASKF